MTDPTKLKSSWKRIRRINMRFLGGLFLGWIGWLCWSNASLELWALWPLGVIGLLGGAIEFGGATLEAIGVAYQHLSWGGYKKLGAKPKADGLAQDQALVDQGRRP